VLEHAAQSNGANIEMRRTALPFSDRLIIWSAVQLSNSNTLAAPFPGPTHNLSRLRGIVITPYCCFLSRISLLFIMRGHEP
jgi:hypothetical protein